jgi:hypothetical protein
MTTSTKYFIAVSSDVTAQITIDGLGHTADQAIQDAVENAQLPSNERENSTIRDQYGDIVETMFIAQECTNALYDFVDRIGGAGLSWEENEDGLQDIEADDEDVVAKSDYGTADELVTVLRDAEDKFHAAGDAPRYLFVQFSNSTGWRSAFSIDQNVDMTSWSSGEDVEKLWRAIRMGEGEVVRNYAADILRGWEPEWNEAA